MLTLIHVSHFPFLFLKQPRSSPELSVVCAELGTCPYRREGLWCEVPLLLLRWLREGSGDSPPCLTDCTAEARPLASDTKKHRQRSSSKPQLQTDSGYKGKATLTGLPQQEGLLESRRVGIRKDIPPQVGGSSTFASLSPECLRRNQATPKVPKTRHGMPESCHLTHARLPAPPTATPGTALQPGLQRTI